MVRVARLPGFVRDVEKVSAVDRITTVMQSGKYLVLGTWRRSTRTSSLLTLKIIIRGGLIKRNIIKTSLKKEKWPRFVMITGGGDFMGPTSKQSEVTRKLIEKWKRYRR